MTEPKIVRSSRSGDYSARYAAILATENAALREKLADLRNVLGEICKDSNPDWSEKRAYPDDVLDDIHQLAANAYYGKSA